MLLGSKSPGAVGVRKARPRRREAVQGLIMLLIIEKKPERCNSIRVLNGDAFAFLPT